MGQSGLGLGPLQRDGHEAGHVGRLCSWADGSDLVVQGGDEPTAGRCRWRDRRDHAARIPPLGDVAARLTPAWRSLAITGACRIDSSHKLRDRDCGASGIHSTRDGSGPGVEL